MWPYPWTHVGTRSQPNTWTGWPRQCLPKHMQERLKRAVGGTGLFLGKTFFLLCQRRHPELPKKPTNLPTYLPTLIFRDVKVEAAALTLIFLDHSRVQILPGYWG